MRCMHISLIFLAWFLFLTISPYPGQAKSPIKRMPEIQQMNLPDIMLPPVVYAGPVLNDIVMNPIIYQGPNFSDIILPPIQFSGTGDTMTPVHVIPNPIPGIRPGTNRVSPNPRLRD